MRKHCHNHVRRKSNRTPASAFADLSLKLEIDLMMGCKRRFRGRLKRALRQCWSQGKRHTPLNLI